jgi:hypothetical protein
MSTQENDAMFIELTAAMWLARFALWRVHMRRRLAGLKVWAFKWLVMPFFGGRGDQ